MLTGPRVPLGSHGKPALVSSNRQGGRLGPKACAGALGPLQGQGQGPRARALESKGAWCPASNTYAHTHGHTPCDTPLAHTQAHPDRHTPCDRPLAQCWDLWASLWCLRRGLGFLASGLKPARGRRSFSYEWKVLPSFGPQPHTRLPARGVPCSTASPGQWEKSPACFPLSWTWGGPRSHLHLARCCAHRFPMLFAVE